MRPTDPNIFRHVTGNKHIFFLRLGRDEVLMVPYKCCFSARSQVGVKIGRGGGGGVLFLKKKTSSSDPKDTATNRMHSNDLEACAKKMLLFLVPFRSQIFDSFLMTFWTLVILVSTGAKGKNGVIKV